jgi:hypothetical protein
MMNFEINHGEMVFHYKTRRDNNGAGVIEEVDDLISKLDLNPDNNALVEEIFSILFDEVNYCVAVGRSPFDKNHIYIQITR